MSYVEKLKVPGRSRDKFNLLISTIYVSSLNDDYNVHRESNYAIMNVTH